MNKNIKVGDKFYSEYFNSKGIVVSYEDENNWLFVLEINPFKVLKAKTTPDKLKWIEQ
jgi:hypothetical protein